MQFRRLKRRDFITLLGGAAVAWPLAARAQQTERIRRIGVLMNFAASDPEGRARFAAFLEGLQQWGWTDGRNVQIDNRWVGSNPEYIRTHAVELVSLTPDVILASASITLGPLQQATRTIPIVFASAIDPVGAGLIASMARPGGNATGFVAFEYSMSAKWLELLKEIAPSVTRAAVLWEPDLTVGIGQLNAIRAAASSFNVELTPVDVRDAGELERAVAEFARFQNGGLIVTGSPTAAARRALIIELADKYRLPAVYVQGYYVTSGGLISYAPSTTEPYRRAASYGRAAGAGADQIRIGDQSQNRQGARP
jgi:putative tryptophan/tyrosine transport system substrate-binding protein